MINALVWINRPALRLPCTVTVCSQVRSHFGV